MTSELSASHRRPSVALRSSDHQVDASKIVSTTVLVVR
jgi:hypothetical protein